MPSPFPGMNPYLERPATWPDVHNDLLIRAREALVRQVRPKYIVRAELRIAVDEEEAVRNAGGPTGRRKRVPDMAVLKGDPNALRAGGTATLTVPVVATLTQVRGAEPWEQVFLQIETRKGRELVTAVELLSPSNKVGQGRVEYASKRREYLREGANLVEIDLLRYAGALAMSDLPPSAYRVMVARPRRLPKVEVWPVHLRDPLPKIPVPLLEGDPDAVLDLQPLLHAAYDGAAYGDYVYEAEPTPRLAPDDLAWARQTAGLPS